MSENSFESEEDFLQDVRFQRWARGEAPEDKHFWQEFLRRHPDKVHLYEKAVAFILVMQGTALPQTESAEKARRIRDMISEAESERPVMQVWRWFRWAVAAMLVVGFGFWWNERNAGERDPIALLSGSNDSAEKMITRENGTKEAVLVNLPDGSSVLLAKGSSVRFDKDMKGGERIVFLTGEGFFEVVKDTQRPFFVFADKVVTRVLGTSFLVRSYPDSSEAIVAVKTGKVAVSSGKNGAGQPTSLTLLPNQQINLLRKNEKLITTITEITKPAEMTPVQQEPFEFQFTPVAEVLKILEANYAVKIHFDEEKMRHCTITASLKDEPFLQKIKLICLATESTFQIHDDQLIIYGNGCDNP
ncbi:FecR family protein [Dyadobacter aurulentus]|uniref:FecR family protein n=1 Tax=Dyadobacter sp. UC 10 TaxID=2605428 RepID=UPI0011F3593E|nr:FecR family protein [Dyadobacter sp. UC 10]KAA0993829.1 DUF4974 domain-containing protein [Dyadobacter sp. UC 10]